MSELRPDEIVRQLAAALRTQSWNGAEFLDRTWTAAPGRPAAAPHQAKGQPLPLTIPAAGGPPTRPTATPPTRPLAATGGPDLRPEVALAALKTSVADCQRCPRAATRRQVVFGAGDPRASLVVIDVAPDAASDAAGTPHAGPAGALLDKMLAAMGLQRSEIWLTSLVLCRGADDGPPTAEAVTACGGYLSRQLDLIRPEVVLLFGEASARAVLRSTAPLSELRGAWRTAHGLPTIATYAPADMLRDAALKRIVWADLQLVMGRLGLHRR